MNDTQKNIKPIPEKIGLCLSGGGYRAAGYHLGTMDYLDRVGLLDKVSMLSTVSGGTFIGTSYTISLIENTSFCAYLNDAYAFLRDTGYIEVLFKYLGSERSDQPGKRRNLIQAAAEVYADGFLYDKKNKEPYRFGTIIEADNIPLHTVIFNATCFYSGLGYKFQKSKRNWIGTPYSGMSLENAKHIRLADIAAASSCFPGGFEPLAMPDDFVWPEHAYPNLITTAVMDGGIVDNVGLNSLQQASELEHDELDLIIASDVDLKPMDLYKDFPLKQAASSFLQKESRIGLTLGALNLIILGTMLLLIATTISLGGIGWRQLSDVGFNLWTLVCYLVAMLVSVAGVLGLFLFRSLFRRKLPEWFDKKRRPGVKGSTWDTFKGLSLGQAINMIKVRVSSIYAMTSNIYLRCIRKLVYDYSYSNPRYNRKIVASLIYSMTQENYDPYIDYRVKNNKPEACKESLPRPSQKLLDVVRQVDAMESTLWWQNACQLPCLVASGQITLCFKLLKHYIDNYKLNEDCLPTDERIRPIFNRLVSDWEAFIKDPFFLMKDRYPGIEIPLVPEDCQEK